MKNSKRKILICQGTGCISSGSLEITKAFEEAITKFEVEDARVIPTGCHGFCQRGPIVIIEPDGVFYPALKPEDAREIVQSHLKNDKPVERLFYKDPVSGLPVANYPEIDFYKKQQRVILQNCGHIDPENIDDYLEVNGYKALKKVLSIMKPKEVIEEIKKAGLRGRGGAGFPTALKWEFCHNAPGPKKYMICNADEGDPGAFMDRSILEADPHSVLEGLIIAGYAIGADEGYIYVRAEYPLAVKRFKIALKQAEERGFLGNNILGSGFHFKMNVMEGAGAFVCGEETSLISSIEGKSGRPRPRPPYPVQSGLWGKPTTINNVKTIVTVTRIILNGSEWYSKIGSEKCTGTAVFALTGQISNIGLVEVAMGTPLRKIIYEIGGGIPNNKSFKAVQTGGPSGGCLPAHLLDLPVDYTSLTEAGSMMGSGGMVVTDEDTCMVDLARFFVDFIQKESCGKCVPCRLGTKQMLVILEEICLGKGRPGDIELLSELAMSVKAGSLCGLGQTAPNSVLSAIRFFRNEFEEHIHKGRCRAGVCEMLFYAPCSNRCPCGVDVPAYVSLIGEDRLEEAMEAHLDRNPFPSVCARVCPHPCEARCRRSTVDEPLAIRALKRFLADQKIDSPLRILARSAEESKKVGVIGGGPAGLSAAYFLRRLGHQVTLFEALPLLGGMLRYGIPAYRLPTESLEHEIKRITDMGIEIKTGKRLGTDFSLEDLKKAFSAIFIGIGAWHEFLLNIPGEEANGVSTGIAFLSKIARGEIKAVEGKVIVVGGGNTAVDAARSALRLGAEAVTIVYRRTRPEMPALAHEIEEALDEGITIKFLAAPKKIMTDEVPTPKVRAMLCQNLELGDFDTGGRRKPIPIPDSTFEIETDLIIVAIGQAPILKEVASLESSDKRTLRVNEETLETSLPGVFAGGDVVLGPQTVVEAVAQGQKAAQAIEKFLNPNVQIEIPWKARKPLNTFFDPEAEPISTERVVPPLVDPRKRKTNFDEIETCISKSVAICEAKRCLRCDFGKDLDKAGEEN